MAALDKNSVELAVDDEIQIRARVLEIFELDDVQILRVEWLTGPAPILDFVKSEHVEKLVSE